MASVVCIEVLDEFAHVRAVKLRAPSPRLLFSASDLNGCKMGANAPSATGEKTPKKATGDEEWLLLTE